MDHRKPPEKVDVKAKGGRPAKVTKQPWIALCGLLNGSRMEMMAEETDRRMRDASVPCALDGGK